jgi:hypothetical protein
MFLVKGKKRGVKREGRGERLAKDEMIPKGVGIGGRYWEYP